MIERKNKVTEQKKNWVTEQMTEEEPDEIKKSNCLSKYGCFLSFFYGKFEEIFIIRLRIVFMLEESKFDLYEGGTNIDNQRSKSLK